MPVDNIFVESGVSVRVRVRFRVRVTFVDLNDQTREFSLISNYKICAVQYKE
jgi:hypothetical protein